MCVCVLSHVQLFATLWTVGHQAPLSTGSPDRNLEWVAVPSLKQSSWSRDQAGVFQVSSFGTWILCHWRQLGSSLRWMLSIRHEVLFLRQLFLNLTITGSLFLYAPYRHHSVLSLLIYNIYMFRVVQSKEEVGWWMQNNMQIHELSVFTPDE